MPQNIALLAKGLLLISTFLLVGFYTSHYLRQSFSDGYVHSGNLNDVGWTGLMGGDGEKIVRVKRFSGNEEFGIVPDPLTAGDAAGNNPAKDPVTTPGKVDEEDIPPIPSNVMKVKRSIMSFSDEDTADDDDDDDDDDVDDDDLTTWDTDDDLATWDTDDDLTSWDTDDEEFGDEDMSSWDDIDEVTSESGGTTGVTPITTTDVVVSTTAVPTNTDATMTTNSISVTVTTETSDLSSTVPTTNNPTTEMPTTVAPTTEPPRDYMRTVEPETLSECQAQPFVIQDACPTDGDIVFESSVNVTMEELSKVMFDVDVLLALENKCDNNTWCLTHEYDKIIWYSSQMYKSYCDFIPCLLDIPDDCLTDERRLTIASLVLLCEADLNNISNPCLLSLRRMSHVAFLSLFRARDEMMYDKICTDQDARRCTGPCYDYSHQLYCTYDSCNESTMWIFQEYGPWQWLFNDQEKMDMCEVTSANCTAFQPPSNLFVAIPENFTTRILAKIRDMDNKLAMGIVMSIFIGLIAFGMVVFVWVKRMRRDSYQREHIEYSRLTKEDELEEA
jgi:hypothetical protein